MRCAVLIFLFAAGCVSREPATLRDDDPARRIPLIIAAAESGNRSALPALIDGLDSADPAVRFYSFDGLRRLTGLDFGYDWRLDEPDRREAVRQWRKALDRGEL
jgi:hypothetical protein